MPGAFYGKNYQARDGELRLLDKSQSGAGASGTPYGYKAQFEQMDGAFGFRPRPQEFPRLNRQRLDDSAHRQLGSDEPLFEGIDATFSFVMSSKETDGLLEFAGTKYMNLESTNANLWNVKGTPAAGLVSTIRRARTGDGLYGGGIVDSKGSIVVLPSLADPKKVGVDIEIGWAERDLTGFFGFRMKEAVFMPEAQRVAESPDFVTVSMTARVYGQIEHITAFSRAIDVLTSQVLTTTVSA